MAIEPTTLFLAPGSPEDLTEQDFAEATNVFNPERLRHGPVKYRRVKKLKRALLEKAFVKFLADAWEARREQFAAFNPPRRVGSRLHIVSGLDGSEPRERSVDNGRRNMDDRQRARMVRRPTNQTRPRVWKRGDSSSPTCNGSPTGSGLRSRLMPKNDGSR